MGGEVGHFEIPADQPERARKFYGAAFGWKFNVMEGMDYTMVQTGPSSEQGMPTGPGYINGGIAKRGSHVMHPVVTIIVPEISEAEAAIRKNGGKVLQGKAPIGDGSMGHTAYFQDPEGNVVGLYQPPPPSA